MSDAPLNVLFIGHEATRTGAPVGFISLMRWFKARGIAQPHIWLRHGGPLLDAHAAIGPLATGPEGEWKATSNERTAHLAYLNTATLGTFAEALAARGIPVICHVHEMEYGLRVTGERNLRLLRQYVTRFIACSYAVRDALVRVLDIQPTQIDVVPECVDVERALRMSAEPLPPGLVLNHGSARLLAGMGTVNWRKGTDLFLRVLAHLNSNGEEWHGVWIGDLDSAPDREELLHDIRVLGLTGRIHFTGSLANPFAVLAKADVYCLTSREDPYPLAMVEAAALGKPLIGFRSSGGVEEFAAEAGGIVVDYADTTAMAQAVRASLTAPAQHGRAAAERLCSPDVVGATIARIMQATATPQPVALNATMAAQLQKASLPPVHTRVRLLTPGPAATELKTCECELTQDGKVELIEPWPQDNGPLVPAFVIAIEPRDRSAVLHSFQVRLRKLTSPESQPLRIKIRTAGRALLCSDSAPKAWLCLDGKGRLLVELNLPDHLTNTDSLEVTATWEQSLNIKEALTPLLKLQPPIIPVKGQKFIKRWWRILQGKE